MNQTDHHKNIEMISLLIGLISIYACYIAFDNPNVYQLFAIIYFVFLHGLIYHFLHNKIEKDVPQEE